MIAIVPARGGSKGLPGKNIKNLLGKPLISYTIAEALKVKEIEKVMISTEDIKIADVACSFGAECPFLRPQYLATDKALAIDNYIYTVDRMRNEFGYQKDSFVVLQPTSPLRQSNDIENAIELFNSKNADSVLSFVEFDHPLNWAVKLAEDWKLSPYFNCDFNKQQNRQQYGKAYMPNGAIYILRLSLLEQFRTYYFENTYAYVMPRERSIDIDTQLDFDIAELIMRKRHESIT